jgi:hypothetical protein
MNTNPSKNTTETGPTPAPDGKATENPRVISWLTDIWQNLSQSSKTVVTKSTAILSWLGITSAFGYATFYARPIWAGIALLAVALVMGFRLWRSESVRNRTGTWVAVGVLLVIAIVTIAFRSFLQREALAHFYSLNPKNLDFGLRRKLLVATADHGTWDQIRRVEIQDVTLLQTSIINETSQKRAETLLEILKRGAKDGEVGHFVTFLIAPFGSGKETIMRQWALSLAQRARDPEANNKNYKYVFFVNLNSDPALAKEESWQKILAKSYREIVDNPAYYDLLFKRENCVILVSGLDRLDSDKDRTNVLITAEDLASNSAYAVDFLFSIRPDTVLRDFAISAELRFDRHVRFLRILDLNKCEWDAYFDQGGLKTVSKKNYEIAKKLIEGDAFFSITSDDKCQVKVPLTTHAISGQNLVAAKLAVNLDLLNLIVEQSKRLEPSTPGFYLCGEMVSRIMERDRTLDNEEAFQSAFADMERLALNASIAGTRNLEFDGRISHDILHFLKGAPLLSVEDGRFIFNPEIVHSYFAVRGLNKAIIETHKQKNRMTPDGKPIESQIWYGKPISDRLLRDIAIFEPLPQELEPIVRYLTCVVKKNQQYYSKAENREQKLLVAQMIKHRSHDDSDCGAASLRR